MAEINNEKLFERVNPSSKSDIDITGANTSSDLGLSKSWAIHRLFADFILVEYIDISEGYIKDEDSGLFMVNRENSSWRKARVCSVSDYSAKVTGLRPGDVVIFPDDKGLKTGKTSYVDAEGNVHLIKNGCFLNDKRIFATIQKI
jgi:hypothetical protein